MCSEKNTKQKVNIHKNKELTLSNLLKLVKTPFYP